MGKTRLEIKGLDKLLRMLKDKSKPFIRVGILGSDASRAHEPETQPEGGSAQTLTIAEIGAMHEYGGVHMPVRSFLRVPLSNNLNKKLTSSGALDKATFAQVMAEGSILPWLKKVDRLAIGVVREAFESGGDGQWPPSNMKNKRVQKTLIESQQLLRAVSSEIKGGGE